MQAGFKADQTKLMNGLSEKEFENLEDDFQTTIIIAGRHCERAWRGMFSSVLFMLTTCDGVVLSIFGRDKLVEQMNEMHNVRGGTIFSLEQTGINAITVARMTKEWVYVSGREHDLEMFSSWSCFCSPVYHNGKIIAYLDMSLSDENDPMLAAGYFGLVLQGIERDLKRSCPENRKKEIYKQFEPFNLTPREKEVGYFWLINQGALQIGMQLGITEGTVRNVIKKVYAKTKVSDKGQYMREFLY
ncbi:helix-turn-helix transcriptional regulator [Paenibacillus sp. HB172176]|uniref:helix-turn-helix transcriptional regulator n=1 Tax=Paenibacillus sp. HB172176 TaxID=2493690 RepID=UPI001438AC05|nr:helix-turn-helix transcriptional regulator [Paenibacillus sp. HB172176]